MKKAIIVSEQEYQEFVQRMAELRNARTGSKGKKELKMLNKAVMQYRRRTRPTPDFGFDQVRY